MFATHRSAPPGALPRPPCTPIHIHVFLCKWDQGAALSETLENPPWFPARSLLALPHTLMQCQCKAGSSNIHGARGVWDHTFQLPSASRLGEKCHENAASSVCWYASGYLDEHGRHAWAASGSSAERKVVLSPLENKCRQSFCRARWGCRARKTCWCPRTQVWWVPTCAWGGHIVYKMCNAYRNVYA